MIRPKPRMAPVQQPAVKYEEVVPAQETAVKSVAAVPVQKPTVKKASPTPAVHRSGSGLIAEVQATNGVVNCHGIVEDEVLRTYARRWLLPSFVEKLKAWREVWAAMSIPTVENRASLPRSGPGSSPTQGKPCLCGR